jgi:histone acetyltransferase (RNA polymerase elongator complex component)
MTGYLTQVQSYLERGKISGIRLSTRPDYITPEILEVLKTYHVGTIELGAQSTDEQVLRRAARGHTAEQIRESAGLIKSAGFRLGLQMMLGLPGDNLEKSFRTACDIVSWKADCTRIYPTLVIKDTPLAKMWQKGLYQELSLAETIDWLRTIIPVFENNHVKIIRIGLHPSEGFLDGSELLAGPFHVALKELVMTEVWFDKLKAALTSRAQSAVVYVHPTEIHYAVGHASKNKTRLQKTHPGLFIRQDVAVKPGTCHVDYC